MSVDYRLAPAHPYPAALEDVDVVYRFLVEHADSYKVDVNRIVIAGDSAGGMMIHLSRIPDIQETVAVPRLIIHATLNRQFGGCLLSQAS